MARAQHWGTGLNTLEFPPQHGGEARPLAGLLFFLNLFNASTAILPATGLVTDHLPVLLTLKAVACREPRGMGIQGFPLQLLCIPAAVAELGTIIQIHTQAIMHSDDDVAVVAMWNAAKEAIRREACSSTADTRLLDDRRYAWQRRLQIRLGPRSVALRTRRTFQCWQPPDS